MEPFELRDDADLLLTAPTSADTDAITAACQDPAVQASTLVPAPYERADAEEFVAGYVSDSWRNGSPAWAVRRREGEQWRFAGVVGLDGVADGSAEIGYWLAPEARGQDLMHRAVGLALDAGFGMLDLERIEWRAFVGNWASWRTVWRHGFRKEGTVRGLGFQRGTRRDQWIGTLLRADPREPAEPWERPGEVLDGQRPAELVAQFHEAFAVPVATDGPSLDRPRLAMRTALIAEEVTELVAAVGGPAAARSVRDVLHAALVPAETPATVPRGQPAWHGDPVAAADALADIVYVVYGMALECDIPLPEVLAEVHAANLAKLGADGRPLLREDGKVLKGPGYRPPDVAAVLERHRRARERGRPAGPSTPTGPQWEA